MSRHAWWVLVLSTAASAQTVTLTQLLESADKNNVDRRVSAEQRSRARAELRQAWTSLLPSLTVAAGWTHNQYDTVFNGVTFTPYDQLDGTLRIDLPLIDTGRWLRSAATSAAEAGAAEREQQTRELIRRQVVESWYRYGAAVAVRESARKSLAVSEEQSKLQAIRESAGAATELERLRANAERARNLQLVADTESLVAVSRRTLRTLTFMDPGDLAPLPADDLRPEPGLVELEQRVEQLPAVKASEKDVQVLQRLLFAQQLALVPVIGAHFTERVSNATGFTPGRNANFNFGVNLTWRLDVQTFQAMQVQQSALSAGRLQAERARLAARDQIHNDWQRQRAAVIKVEAARAQVEAARRAATVARDRYAVGASTQVEVIQAERDLFGAEVAQIQARTDLASARAGLRISAGLPLE